MRRLALVLVAALLSASPVSAAGPILPEDRRVPMVRDERGDPVALPADRWMMLQPIMYEGCAGALLTDGARYAAVLYVPPIQETTPAVFYAIYEPGMDTPAEWAGDLALCTVGARGA